MDKAMWRDRAEQLRHLEPLVQDRPDAMIALARQFAAIGERDSAIELAVRARALVPGDSEIGVLAAEVLSDNVPNWHLSLLRDTVRNQAYEEAIRRAVTPGCTVLEIGTGSGILAMMAARAGARVVTCEMDPSVAAAARAVIAANGLTDRICVVNKHSSLLDPVTDLGGPADILVSEIVSNDLLSEGVLPAHADAVARLLKPGARVIPARGRIRAALAYSPGEFQYDIGNVSGFDLSAFARVSRPYRQVRTGSGSLVLRGDGADLFDFDFGAAGPWRDRRTRIALRSSGGTVNGVVQWIALDFDETGRYENQPEPGRWSCWGPYFWKFAQPIETRAGDSIAIGGYHTAERVRLWRDEEVTNL
jgi:type II protein arginine methyltransferase